MRLRRILHARMEGRTSRIGPQVQEFKIIFVLLPKRDSRRAPADRIDVELDGTVAERDVFQRRVAAVQPHQAVIKTQLAKKLRVLLGLPLLSRHAYGNWFRAPGNGCEEKTYAERQPFQRMFADKLFHVHSVRARRFFGELSVTKRTGVLRGDLKNCNKVFRSKADSRTAGTKPFFYLHSMTTLKTTISFQLESLEPGPRPIQSLSLYDFRS